MLAVTGARACALIFLMNCGVRNLRTEKNKNLSTRVGLHYHPFTAVSSTMPRSHVPLNYFVVVHIRHLLHCIPSRNARLHQRGATIAPAIATEMEEAWRACTPLVGDGRSTSQGVGRAAQATEVTELGRRQRVVPSLAL